MSIQLLILHRRTDSPCPRAPWHCSHGHLYSCFFGLWAKGKNRWGESFRAWAGCSFGSVLAHRGSGASLCVWISALFWLYVSRVLLAEKRIFLDSPRLGFKMQFHDRQIEGIGVLSPPQWHFLVICTLWSARSVDSNGSHVCTFPVAIPAAPGRGGSCCLLETSLWLSLWWEGCYCCRGMEQEMCRAGGRGGLPLVWPARITCGRSATGGRAA